MSATAEAQPVEPRIVGKKQLCEALGWSRMKLDRRLEADAAFPVKARGTQAGGWGFDLDAVSAYLAPEDDREARVEDLAQPGALEARTELTARNRRDLAQAQLHEDKLRRMRGDLVEAEALRMALSETVSRVNTALNKMPETLTRRLSLPAAARAVLQQEIDEVRRHMVIGLRELLADA